MSHEALGPRRSDCDNDCPLCILDRGGRWYKKLLSGFVTVHCENGCCHRDVPSKQIKAVMVKLDENLRWETDIKLSSLCSEYPKAMIIVPMLVTHNPSKWSRAVDFDDIDEDEIRRLTNE